MKIGEENLYKEPHFYQIEFLDFWDDLPFYQTCFNQKPECVALELGPGLGRLSSRLSPLSKAYFGLEKGEAMAQKCLENSIEEGYSVQLVVGDMGEMPFGKGFFDLILAPFNVLMHLKPDRVNQFFQGIPQFLSPGGIFLGDFTLPSEDLLLKASKKSGLTLERERVGKNLDREEFLIFDPHTKQLSVFINYFERGGSKPKKILHYQQNVAVFLELETLLKISGLKNIEIKTDHIPSLGIEVNRPRQTFRAGG